MNNLSMLSSRKLVIAISMLFLSGCGQIGKKGNDAKSDAEIYFESARYAGYAVFGGSLSKSETAFTEEDLGAPIWRWVVCLDRSGEKRQGQIQVEFAKLGMPAYMVRSTTNGTTTEESIPTITVGYSYEARLERFNTYVSHRIQFNSNVSDNRLNGYVFPLNWEKNSVSKFVVTQYAANNAKYSLYTTLKPYFFDPKSDSNDRMKKINETCEGRGFEPFLQTNPSAKQ